MYLQEDWSFSLISTVSSYIIDRDSNPPVLAGNLLFLEIISILPFSLQNLPFFVFFEKESNLLYLFSEIE